MKEHRKLNRLLCIFLAIVFSFLNTPVAECNDAAVAAQSPPVPSKTRNTLDNLVRNWLRVPTLEHSNVGLEIMQLPSGKILYSFNGARRFTPASTVKAITNACAYDTFGPNYTFKTAIIAEGTLANTVLHGNLIIVPSQDPTMTRGQLQELIKEAVQNTARIDGSSPISQIDGQIKIAGYSGTETGFHPSWLVEDWGRHWMPVSSHLVLDNNIAYPESLPEGYRVIEAANTSGALFDNSMNAPDGPAWCYLDKVNKVVFTYKPHNPQAPKSANFVVSNPDDFNLALADAMVRRHGIKVLGGNITPTGADKVYQLGQHESKPISEIIKKCLHESDNLYAQQLLRAIGANAFANKDGKAPSPNKSDNWSAESKGLIAVSRWLSKIGVPGQEAIIFDGCGLCRKNGVTPHALNVVMKYMAGEKANGPWLNLLRANDETGSGLGSYKYKTGTMDTVRCMSGVLTTSGNEPLAVTVMVNGHTPSVRNLRIAISSLIMQLRAIKHFGEATPKELAGAPDDPNVTATTNAPVVVNMNALKAAPKAKPSKRKSRGRARKR